MSAFVVISAHERLNPIVDGIVKNRPLNSSVCTVISTGKLLTEGEEAFYEYTSTVKDSSKNKGSQNFENLLKNQLAHLRRDALLGDRILNVFLLENPHTIEEDNNVDWIYNCLKDVYSNGLGSDSNIQLFRICFSYHIEEPENVALQIPKALLQKRKEGLSDNIPQKILYLDNQDKNGAALCKDKESHDLMVSRMLVDWMMLLSNENDSYSMMNAIQSETKIFTLGYAEYFYYYDDICNYFRLSNQHDILEYMLYGGNDEHNNSLDIEKEPLGLIERKKRMSSIYEKIPYSEDIELYPMSIDKRIDDIIVSFKSSIEKCKEKALEEARTRDEKNWLVQCEQEINNENETLSSKPRIGSEEELVRKEYPDYIDRSIIYTNSLLLDANDESGNNEKIILSYQDNYNKVLSFIQGQVFKTYLSSSDTQNKTKDTISQEKPAKGCLLWFLNLFGKNDGEIIKDNSIIEVENSGFDLKRILQPLNDIRRMQNERNLYLVFKQNVDELLKQKEDLESKIKNFKLTKHCKSVDTMIDLKLLKDYQKSLVKDNLNTIIEKWKSVEEEKRTKRYLFECQLNYTKSQILKYQFVDWSRPFHFIKDKRSELSLLGNQLLEYSSVFANYNVIRDSLENLTCIHLYSDNEEYVSPFANRQIDMRNKNSIQAIKSNHIASKIAMIQILQMDEEAWSGLVDLNEVVHIYETKN